ncbi:MAG: sigma-70 family RNA polymerase sigma factor [Phycisphaerae bacterium]
MDEWITTSTILNGLRDFQNPAAWDRLCERFRIPIVAFARRLGLPHTDAEDVAQTTLLTFAQRLREHAYDRERGRLRAWLFGIAYHCARDLRRRRAADVAQAAPGQSTTFWADVADEDSATKTWDEEWERAMLERCLRSVRRELSEQSLRAFELVTQQGRSADDAARELGMSREAVYVAKHRVLKRLRELAQQYEDPFEEPPQPASA